MRTLRARCAIVAGRGKAAAFVLALACARPPIAAEGQFGRAIPLATGDASDLPRLAILDAGCPKDQRTRGGCEGRDCALMLVDSLAPVTVLPGETTRASVARECIEIRAARGLAAANPSGSDLALAVARFRFVDAPVVRADPESPNGWAWDAGDGTTPIRVGAVIGGSLLSAFAVRFRHLAGEDPTLTFYREFPGTNRDLANQGRAFIPLQFPGRLLGRDVNDRCELDGDNCELSELDIRPDDEDLALVSTRMVLDACVAAPPCSVAYDPAQRTCTLTRNGSVSGPVCVDPTAPDGGRTATFVVATGLPGLVLVDDSARRLFGVKQLADLPACSSDSTGEELPLACYEGDDGTLRMAGWPPAGVAPAPPLERLRVRALALLPGLTTVDGCAPCGRLGVRLEALRRQCERTAVQSTDGETALAKLPASHRLSCQSDASCAMDTSDAACHAAAVRGETRLAPGSTSVDVERWLPTLVLPATHPMVIAVRRDVTPWAVELDGFVGTTLFSDTEVILDYTDLDPGIRVSCLVPERGDCMAAPACARDGQAACCHGLPSELLLALVTERGDETCCDALGPTTLAMAQALDACKGVDPP